ncbi:GNAT family N-acetyltransferase [Paenibacillus rigui]|uniref:GNAT family N-acetyltransferase n=1 Tax=Paenibacillus rigui TaxID=554312 RepID=A0A229UWY2_9BACL|nr:GNAT family N-acetyltransferase [Paenibacillus rigui]OXM87924.1 GNAT family N-acetyltransferase [Paenibacillus rigui]
MQIHIQQTIQHIERLALHTWPAQNQKTCDRWILRASQGITKRGNSVWTSTGTMPSDPDWFSKAESFYHSQGLPLRFHISDATDPALLTLLKEKKFTEEVPCSVFIAAANQVIEQTRNIHNLFTYTIQEEPDEAWLSHYMDMEGYGQDERKKIFYDRILKEIPPVKGFITVYSGNTAIAVGTTVIEDGWAGLLNIVVHPFHRGKGIGKVLIHQLAVWSLGQGASQLFLQVVNDNEPACRLYQGTGFTPLFAYHYRCEPNKCS